MIFPPNSDSSVLKCHDFPTTNSWDPSKTIVDITLGARLLDSCSWNFTDPYFLQEYDLELTGYGVLPFPDLSNTRYSKHEGRYQSSSNHSLLPKKCPGKHNHEIQTRYWFLPISVLYSTHPNLKDAIKHLRSTHFNTDGVQISSYNSMEYPKMGRFICEVPGCGASVLIIDRSYVNHYREIFI